MHAAYISTVALIHGMMELDINEYTNRCMYKYIYIYIMRLGVYEPTYLPSPTIYTYPAYSAYHIYIYTHNHLGALTYQCAADLEPVRVAGGYRVLFYLLLLTHLRENENTYLYVIYTWQPFFSPPLYIKRYIYIYIKATNLKPFF